MMPIYLFLVAIATIVAMEVDPKCKYPSCRNYSLRLLASAS